MLTRAKLKCGKGKLASYKPKIQREFCKKEIASKEGRGEVPDMGPKEF